MEYGKFNISNDEYRAIDAISNGALQLFAKDPSLYVWNKTAPHDPNKANTADFGSALHVLLLEPQLFDEKILVSSVKGRTTKTFIDEQVANPDKIVLTESEVDQLNVMKLSAAASPMFKRILDADGFCESSIIVRDEKNDIDLKIRVDKIIEQQDNALFCDLKSTSDIEEWRSDKHWINPLFKHGYGFTAAFYMHAGSLHYGFDLDEYCFPLVQKSSSMGRYPVSVFRITREELIQYGFWAQVQNQLSLFSKALKTNNFVSFEQFPNFN